MSKYIIASICRLTRDTRCAELPQATAPFLRYNDMLVENRPRNLLHLHLAPQLGVMLLKFCLNLWHR